MMRALAVLALALFLGSCGLIPFSVNGAGVTLIDESNNTLNGGCNNDDFIDVEINTADLAASLQKKDQKLDFKKMCLDSDVSKLQLNFTFQLDSISTSLKSGDECVMRHSGPYGKYSVEGLTFFYDYVENGQTKSDEFTMTCSVTTIDFGDFGNLAERINGCLDEIQTNIRGSLIVAINRHPDVIHVRSATESCDPDACFNIGYTFKMVVEKSLAHACN